MPTTRPRHTITETEPVKRALDALRSATGSDAVDLPALVILGAEEQTRRLASATPAAQRARKRLADLVVAGDPLVDVDAADAVKRLRLER